MKGRNKLLVDMFYKTDMAMKVKPKKKKNKKNRTVRVTLRRLTARKIWWTE